MTIKYDYKLLTILRQWNDKFCISVNILTDSILSSLSNIQYEIICYIVINLSKNISYKQSKLSVKNIWFYDDYNKNNFNSKEVSIIYSLAFKKYLST